MCYSRHISKLICVAWITHKVLFSIAEVPHNDPKGEAGAFYFCYLTCVKKENPDCCVWAQTWSYPRTSAWKPHCWKSWEVLLSSSVWPYSAVHTKFTLVSITGSSAELSEVLWGSRGFEGRHRTAQGRAMTLAAGSPSPSCPKIQPCASHDTSLLPGKCCLCCNCGVFFWGAVFSARIFMLK